MLFAMRWIPSEIFVIRKPEADISKRKYCLQLVNGQLYLFQYNAFQ